MEGRIVAVHVLVETLHDVRKRLDVGDVGLLPEPFGERIDRAQIFGIGNAAFASQRPANIPAGPGSSGSGRRKSESRRNSYRSSKYWVRLSLNSMRGTPVASTTTAAATDQSRTVRRATTKSAKRSK